jgi:hypothetical protein
MIRIALIAFVTCFVAAALPGCAYYAFMRIRHPEWWQD